MLFLAFNKCKRVVVVVLFFTIFFVKDEITVSGGLIDLLVMTVVVSEATGRWYDEVAPLPELLS